MNLALHGFLLQVFLSILNFHHGRLLCSTGEPGYLDFDNLPETNFSCQGKVIGGYYADIEAGCQMFHVCTIGQKDEIMDIKFLCLNGTVFDQETRVCERVDEVDCSKSERFYNLNLELYGNNAVTLSLHEKNNEDDLSDMIENHQPRTTSVRPSTSTTSATTSRSSKLSTTITSGSFQDPTGYPQHYQPQPPFPQIHTSPPKALYDDKNDAYHHQYIFHSGEREHNNQATSYQLFNNQGVSSTTIQPQPSLPLPQIHQIRFSSTLDPQIIHNEQSTMTPLYHVTSSTIQTLLNNNANSPALINPIFHGHGIASTTEQFTVHNNNPREISNYRNDDVNHEQIVRPLEAIQPTNKGQISKLSISPILDQQELSRTVQTKTTPRSQQQRISNNFLPTTIDTTVKSFYPTPRPLPKSSQSQLLTQQVTQHIHASPDVTIPLKSHQISIKLPSPDIQKIIQNPSPLLPSQSRVIVTAKASVSDESGRPLNTTQLVTLPLPTIPASYDDYKEGDESFDPFYRDVPKIRKNRRVLENENDDLRLMKKRRKRKRRSLDQDYSFIYDVNSRRKEDLKRKKSRQIATKLLNEGNTHEINVGDLWVKESLVRLKRILYNNEMDGINTIYNGGTEQIGSNIPHSEIVNVKSVQQMKNMTRTKVDSLEDLKTEASKHLHLSKEEDADEDTKEEENDERSSEKSNDKINNKKVIVEDKSVESKLISEATLESEIKDQHLSKITRFEENASQKDIIDVIIVNGDEMKLSSSISDDVVKTSNADASIEITIEEEAKSHSPDLLETNEKPMHNKQIAEHMTKTESLKQLNSQTTDVESQLEVPEKITKIDIEQKPDSKPRSLKRRISSRVKQQRMDPIGAEINHHNEKSNKTMITTTTTPNTTITTISTTTTTTITPPSVILSEIQVVEQIDSYIFEKPESQTSKEINMQAIDQQVTFSKISQNSHNDDMNKSKKIELPSKMELHHQTTMYYTSHENQFVDKSEEKSEADSSDYTENDRSADVNFSENSQNVEDSLESNEAASTEIVNTSEEKLYVEKSSSSEYEIANDEFPTKINDEKSNILQQALNNISFSHQVAVSNKSNSYQEASFFQEIEQNEKSNIPKDNLDKEEDSITIKNSEEMFSSEELNEYQDMTKSSAESAQDVSTQEDYKELGSIEYSTVPVDYISYDEYVDTREDITGSTKKAEIKNSSESVLKFTDELPKLNYTEDTKEPAVTSKPYEFDAYDYIDDNYEREDYKQLVFNIKLNDRNNEKNELNERKNLQNVTEKNSVHEKSAKTNDDIDHLDSVEAETHAEHINVTEFDETANVTMAPFTNAITFTSVMPSSTPESVMVSTTPITAFTTESTTVPTTISTTVSATKSTTTTESLTMMTPIITTTTSTIISRHTPPKLFKPNYARRTYAYIPPTTTPVPVVIRPRLGLFNPKPAKPPKSYNELAPKPVIRKLPLLTRQPTIPTITSTLATTITDKTNLGYQEITTKSMITKSTTTTAATTLMETTMMESTFMVTMTNITESKKSKNNVLESKLEATNHEPLSLNVSIKSNTHKEDQLVSPSEQDSPVNSSRDLDLYVSTKKFQNFTPYPLTKLPTLTISTEQTTKKAESKTYETVESTDFLTMSTLPTTFSPEKSEYIETNTEMYTEEADITTMVALSKVYEQDIITESQPIYSERPNSISRLATVPSKNVYSDTTTKSIVLRPMSQKPTSSLRKHMSFNCLKKEMYRFYGDSRDCRLFHYCSPGFTKRQVLDFRFVCEEGTTFDEQTQSCRHDVRNRKCRHRF